MLLLAAALGDIDFLFDALFLATAGPPLGAVTLGCGRLFLCPVNFAFRGLALETFLAVGVLFRDGGRFFPGPRFLEKAAPPDDVVILDGARPSFRAASFAFEDFALEGFLGTSTSDKAPTSCARLQAHAG